VHTFAYTSDSGAWPPRSAAQNVAREASSSQRSSEPGVRPARSGPSAGCAVGGRSPSQSTLPCSQLSRHAPYQLVSAPGEHQEPEKVCTAPESKVIVTVAAASPAYQLQEGLKEVAVTETGAPSTSTRPA